MLVSLSFFQLAIMSSGFLALVYRRQRSLRYHPTSEEVRRAMSEETVQNGTHNNVNSLNQADESIGGLTNTYLGDVGVCPCRYLCKGKQRTFEQSQSDTEASQHYGQNLQYYGVLVERHNGSCCAYKCRSCRANQRDLFCIQSTISQLLNLQITDRAAN